MGYTVNPDLFVEQYYQMNPATEDLIWDGTNLRNGMVVLIENNNFRKDTERLDALNGCDLDAAYRYNRWAKISHLTINVGDVTFMATYLDGSKKKVRVETSQAWFVKLDSMPAENEPEQQGTIPVYNYNEPYAGTPKNVLSGEGVSYSPFSRGGRPLAVGQERAVNFMGKAPVGPLPPSLENTGSIPRIPWKATDAPMIEEPSHFNQTRESWEQNRGGAPIN